MAARVTWPPFLCGNFDVAEWFKNQAKEKAATFQYYWESSGQSDPHTTGGQRAGGSS